MSSIYCRESITMHSTNLACLLGLVFFNFGHATQIVECILIVGGDREWTSTSMEYFCPQWVMFNGCQLDTKLLKSRTNHVAGLLDGDVILTGGLSQNSTETFNPETWEQKKRGDKLLSLEFAGAAVINDSFFVCGGRSSTFSSKASNVCMAYKSEHWAEVEPMKHAREAHGFVAVDNYLYAFGGAQPHSPYVLSSMERFDTLTKKWEEMPSMLTPRRDFGFAVLGDSIYACGGTDPDSIRSIRSCESYSLESKKWEYSANMTHKRQKFTLTAFKGRLYAIGGEDPPGLVGGRVEAYDPDRKTWAVVSRTMHHRTGHSATAVQFKCSPSEICLKPITTTTAKPDSASLYSPINIIGLLFLGFWAIKLC